MERRLKRLSEGERAEVLLLSARLNEGDTSGRLQESDKAVQDMGLARFGELIAKADAFDPLPQTEEANPPIEIDAVIFNSVWQEADEMRRSGRLLEAGKAIRCPVVAIHGDYDPHPAAGVEQPLSAILSDFRFILLPQCGHRPWIERHARDRFFQIL